MRSHVHLFPLIVIDSSKTNDNEQIHKNINIDNSIDVFFNNRC